MSKLNTSLILILVSIFIFTACKTEKVVRSSSKNPPSWLYGLAPDRIIVYGDGRNHNDAQQQAFGRLKESLVQAISVRVSSEISIQVSEKVANDVFNYSEKTKVNTRIQSDFLNAINGLNLNKADDFYWEQIYNRKTKQTHVRYHVKYPFTTQQVNDLVTAWQQTDRLLNQEVDSLRLLVQNSSNVSDIVDVKNRAGSIANFSLEPRKSRASALEAQANALLNNAKLEILEHRESTFLARINSNGRHLEHFAAPILHSSCATLTSSFYSEKEKGYWVSYDASFCPALQPEEMRLEVKFNGKTLSAKVTAEPDATKPALSIIGNIEVLNLASPFGQCRFIIPMRSFNDNAFTVKRINLVVERQSGRLLAALSKNQRNFVEVELNQVQSKKGDFFLEFDGDFSFSQLESLVNSVSGNSTRFAASGFIEILSKRDQKITRVPISAVPIAVKM